MALIDKYIINYCRMVKSYGDINGVSNYWYFRKCLLESDFISVSPDLYISLSLSPIKMHDSCTSHMSTNNNYNNNINNNNNKKRLNISRSL